MARYVTYTNTSSELLFISEEHSLYGSARIGVDGRKDTLYKAGAYTPACCGTQSVRRELGRKQYELTNHLGNVLSSVTDKKAYKNLSGSICFEAEITTLSDYYPFGSAMQTRGFAAGGYRFGFNTQEKDNEIGSDIYTAQFWEYDGRLGRRWNVDPVMKLHLGGYICLHNNPLLYIDVDGDDDYFDCYGNFVGSYGSGSFIRVINSGIMLNEAINNPEINTKTLSGINYSVGKIGEENRELLKRVLLHYKDRAGIVDNNVGSGQHSDQNGAAFYSQSDDIIKINILHDGSLNYSVDNLHNLISILIHENYHRFQIKRGEVITEYNHVDAIIAPMKNVDNYRNVSDGYRNANVQYATDLLNSAIDNKVASIEAVKEKIIEFNQAVLNVTEAGGDAYVLTFDDNTLKVSNDFIVKPVAKKPRE